MRIRLVMFVLIGLSLMPFLVNQILLAQKNMRSAVDVAEDSLQLSLGRAEDMFADAQTELENLSSTVALIDSLRYVSPEQCGQTLSEIANAYSSVEAIALLTPQGTAYCASEPRAFGVSFAERQYFTDSLPSKGIVWGDLQVSKVTGRVIVASARAVRHAGEVSFVVLVLLDVAALKDQTFEQFQLHVAQAALVNGKGDILDRIAFDDGVAPFDAATRERLGSAGTGILKPETRDAASTLIGVMKLPMADGRIVFSAPIGQIYAEARREMIAAIVLTCLETLVIAVFLLAALELLILRGLRRIAQFAGRITAGNHNQRVIVRSPLPEFAILSSALNMMIDTLEKASFTDALTGLANRRALEVHFGRCDERLGKTGVGFSIAMIDIDHFKLFNDRFGHATGDAVLRMVGETLRGSISSEGEVAARYGGEEFTLILSGTGRESVTERLETLRRAVEDLDILHPDSPHDKLTVSIGFATAQPGGAAQETLERADLALYAAKAAGRNRVESEARPLPSVQDLPWPDGSIAAVAS